MEYKTIVKQKAVFKYWKEYDTQKNGPIMDELATMPIEWSMCKVEQGDLPFLNIINAADWLYDYALTFNKTDKTISNRLSFVYSRYRDELKKDNIRALQILARREAIKNDRITSVKNLILLTHDKLHYVAFEGNRRMIALYDIGKLIGRTVYVGYCPEIADYEKGGVVRRLYWPGDAYVANQETLDILNAPSFKYIWYNNKWKNFGENDLGYTSTDELWYKFQALHSGPEWILIKYKPRDYITTIQGIILPI